MIFGFPGEGEKERRESVALIMDICRRYPGAEFWTNIFTPYPGCADHAARVRTWYRRAEDAGRLGRFLPPLQRVAVAERAASTAKCRPCASICASRSTAFRSAFTARILCNVWCTG